MKICCLTIASQRSFCRELLFQTIALQIISYEKMKNVASSPKKVYNSSNIFTRNASKFWYGSFTFDNSFLSYTVIVQREEEHFPTVKIWKLCFVWWWIFVELLFHALQCLKGTFHLLALSTFLASQLLAKFLCFLFR